MIFDKNQIKLFLPHRDPFLFVDEVESIELQEGKNEALLPKDLLGGKVVAYYFTDPHHAIFKGHFPGRPILPGVVQIEMMAQASSFLITKLLKAPLGTEELKLEVALLSVEGTKFRKPIYPSFKLQIKTECQRFRSNMMTCRGEIFHEGELMSECTAMAYIKI